MKFIILQTAGKHDGSTQFTKNDYLRECLSLQYALHMNKQQADIWGPGHKYAKTKYGNIYSLKKKINLEIYDFIFIIENYDKLWIDLSKIRKPKKIQWIVDLHFNNWHYYKDISQHCDIILHSTKLLIDSYKKLFPKKEHIWFPNAIDSRYFYNMPIKKNLDFIFVGNIVNSYRKNYIEQLMICSKMKYYNKTGQDMISLIMSTKIHFNLSCSIDVNYRNFETIALGTCLLTNYLEELKELGFKDGINCVMYHNLEDCKKKVKDILYNDKWKKIGKAGLKLSKQHNYIIRIKNLLPKIMKKLN